MFWVKSWEKQINNLCESFKTELETCRRSMLQEIDVWGNALLAQIHSHILEQKNILNQEYLCQKADIDTIRRDYVDTGRKHDSNHDTEQINHLITQCKTLTFQLGALEFTERSLPFIVFLKEEREKQNQSTLGNDPKKDFQTSSRSNGDSYERQISTDSIQMK